MATLGVESVSQNFCFSRRLVQEMHYIKLTDHPRDFFYLKVAKRRSKSICQRLTPIRLQNKNKMADTSGLFLISVQEALVIVEAKLERKGVQIKRCTRRLKKFIEAFIHSAFC